MKQELVGLFSVISLKESVQFANLPITHTWLNYGCDMVVLCGQKRNNILLVLANL